MGSLPTGGHGRYVTWPGGKPGQDTLHMRLDRLLAWIGLAGIGKIGRSDAPPGERLPDSLTPPAAAPLPAVPGVGADDDVDLYDLIEAEQDEELL